jgi:hypothetical protein
MIPALPTDPAALELIESDAEALYSENAPAASRMAWRDIPEGHKQFYRMVAANPNYLVRKPLP